ncbi:Ribonuclease P/MRP protein subunit POP5 [Tolypocladium ophioglossoides CBS 100239]|uniref:Ribonuclease P/MRP protein subunit POP5 n=1 Tax=Tolypocladium ophioglossoides (strain CBS 100239) TaxID=1163406 RepID=A0A0L0N170_TOLOC|nr:Ribonuclease P/MRP protein subunit POP5 [Tolypocladium ophioglossoides CBS 100239]
MVRIKERYLLVNIVYPPDPAKRVPDLMAQSRPTMERLTPPALLKAIRAEVAQMFGDYGSGALEGHLSVKYLSLATSTFILRCSRSHYQMLWAALTFMDHVPVKDGQPCIFRVVRVSGTMRKASEEAIRQSRRIILAAKQEISSVVSQTDATQHNLRDQLMLEYVTGGDSSDDAMGEDDS